MSPSAIITQEIKINLDSINSYYPKDSYIELNGANAPKNIIGSALKQRVENIDNDICEADDEDAFFVADLGEVYRQHMRWKRNLPRVKPFYGQYLAFMHTSDENLLTSEQRSNATQTHKSFVSWRSLGQDLTVLPRAR